MHRLKIQHNKVATYGSRFMQDTKVTTYGCVTALFRLVRF